MNNIELWIYLSSVIDNLRGILILFTALSFGLLLLFGLYCLITFDFPDDNRDRVAKYLKPLLISGVIFSCLQVPIPSSKTMYLIMGVKTTRAIVNDPKVQQISDRVFNILDKKLSDLEQTGLDLFFLMASLF